MNQSNSRKFYFLVKLSCQKPKPFSTKDKTSKVMYVYIKQTRCEFELNQSQRESMQVMPTPRKQVVTANASSKLALTCEFVWPGFNNAPRSEMCLTGLTSFCCNATVRISLNRIELYAPFSFLASIECHSSLVL